MAIVTSPSGFDTRSITEFQRLMSGFGAGSMPNAAKPPVETRRVIGVRHFIDRADIARFDDGAFPHIAEEPDLPAFFARDFAIGPAEQDVRLDADRAEFLDRMLGRLGLEFAGAGNITASSVRCT